MSSANRDSKGRGAPIRLHVFMARSGVASRRRSEELIAEGRVRVNGKQVTEQGHTVEATDLVTVDGKPIRPTKRLVYVALHKPPQYLCSASDPEGRPLALDLLRPAYPMRLHSVGRLDFLSSGLMFFTNDGEFTRKVSHPSSEVEKEYLVRTGKPLPDELLERFVAGVEVEGVQYRIKSYRRKNSHSAYLVLVEGKNREIRRVFHHMNLDPKRVHRVRIGPVKLGDLPSGRFRALTAREIAWFRDNLPESPR